MRLPLLIIGVAVVVDAIRLSIGSYFLKLVHIWTHATGPGEDVVGTNFSLIFDVLEWTLLFGIVAGGVAGRHLIPRFVSVVPRTSRPVEMIVFLLMGLAAFTQSFRVGMVANLIDILPFVGSNTMIVLVLSIWMGYKLETLFIIAATALGYFLLVRRVEAIEGAEPLKQRLPRLSLLHCQNLAVLAVLCLLTAFVLNAIIQYFISNLSSVLSIARVSLSVEGLFVDSQWKFIFGMFRNFTTLTITMMAAMLVGQRMLTLVTGGVPKDRVVGTVLLIGLGLALLQWLMFILRPLFSIVAEMVQVGNMQTWTLVVDLVLEVGGLVVTGLGVWIGNRWLARHDRDGAVVPE